MTQKGSEAEEAEQPFVRSPSPAQRASGACCFNIGGQEYRLLKHTQACRWRFINYRWMGEGATPAEEARGGGRKERGVS